MRQTRLQKKKGRTQAHVGCCQPVRVLVYVDHVRRLHNRSYRRQIAPGIPHSCAQQSMA